MTQTIAIGMTHDPLCAWWKNQCDSDCSELPFNSDCKHMFCMCDLIAKVRADERSRHLPQYGSGSYASGATNINSLI